MSRRKRTRVCVSRTPCVRYSSSPNPVMRSSRTPRLSFPKRAPKSDHSSLMRTVNRSRERSARVARMSGAERRRPERAGASSTTESMIHLANRAHQKRQRTLRAQARINTNSWPPMHPVWLRCKSFRYLDITHSLRLARRAPRRPRIGIYSCLDPKAGRAPGAERERSSRHRRARDRRHWAPSSNAS